MFSVPLLKRPFFFAILLGIFALSGHAASAAGAPPIHISNNWAGYAASGESYTGAQAIWTVPDPSTTSRVISADAEWVGVGGIHDDDLVQAGTQAVIRNGRTEYTAWYELLPDTQRTVPLEIKPGDRIFASVSEVSTDLWRIIITDLSTGQSYQTAVPYHSSHSSAEWVVERPLAITSGATGYLPLSDFGAVTFQNAALTTSAGKMETLGSSHAQKLIMSSSGSRIFAAPAVAGDSSFTVSYLTSTESSSFLRTLRRTYELQPQTNVSSRSPHYEDINTSFIIRVVFGGSR